MKSTKLSFILWSLATLTLLLILTLPLLSVLSQLFLPFSDNWYHILDTVFFHYISNSLYLCIGVGIGVLILGGSSAWLVTMYDFPGKKILEWLLLLPLAIPAYILAYIYTDLFDISGPVYEFMQLFDLHNEMVRHFDIRTLPGAIIIFSFAFYPYVYLLARTAYIEQSVCLLEVSQTLGCGPWKRFLLVALPLSRPALISGIILSLMEVLNDFGAVQYFGISTFTVGIFRSWLGLGDSIVASQLASILLLFIFMLIFIEKISRGKARYHATTQHHRCLTAHKLKGKKAFFASIACFIPPIIGFIIPIIILVIMSFQLEHFFTQRYIHLIKNSFSLSVISGIIAILFSLILSYSLRFQPNKLSQFSFRMASVGYAIPGAVLAVGILGPLANFDHWIDGWLNHYFNISSGLLLSGSMIALLYAYLVRFIPCSLHAIDSGLNKSKTYPRRCILESWTKYDKYISKNSPSFDFRKCFNSRVACFCRGNERITCHINHTTF